MPTKIVLSETVLYSSLCTDNVTFISDQIVSFNCNVCVLAARSRHARNELSTYRTCRLPGADVGDRLVICGLLVSHSLKQAQDIQVPY